MCFNKPLFSFFRTKTIYIERRFRFITVFGFCDASGAYAYMHVIVQLVYLLVVVQSKHSVVEAEQNFIESGLTWLTHC